MSLVVISYISVLFARRASGFYNPVGGAEFIEPLRDAS